MVTIKFISRVSKMALEWLRIIRRYWNITSGEISPGEYTSDLSDRNIETFSLWGCINVTFWYAMYRSEFTISIIESRL